MTTLAIGLIYTIYDKNGENLGTVPMSFDIKNRSFVSQVYVENIYMNCQHCGRKVTKLVVDNYGKCWGKDCFKKEFGIDLQANFDEVTNIHAFSTANELAWQIIEVRKGNEKFFNSLYNQICAYGKLSDKQIACVIKAGMPTKLSKKEELEQCLAIWEKVAKNERKAIKKGCLASQELLDKAEVFVSKLKLELATIK